jgi:uncharacterized repeat protein (TIGR04138 family)
MPVVDPKHPLFQLLQRDRRYTLDAYLFVLESLTFAQETLGLGQEPAVEELEPLRGGDETAAMGRDSAASDRSPGSEGRDAAAEGRARVRSGRGRKRQAERHVSGQQLCEAARLFGLQQYGFLAPKVLESWGIRRTDDLGEIVFNMIEIGQMRKTRSDQRDHFRAVYDFAEAFSRDLSFAVPDVV